MRRVAIGRRRPVVAVAGIALLNDQAGFFQQAEVPVTESDLLVVQLPEGKQPLIQICKALLTSEVSIHYAYPLLVGPAGLPSLALYVDNHKLAVQTLTNQRFTVFTENDLSDPPPY